jgi:glycerophosphoryl diester phosphodiesterase
VLVALRLGLPFRIAGLVEEVGASAVTLKHEVVSRSVVERCHELGVAVLVWTVNDGALFRRLDALGVDGVISDDPRLFQQEVGLHSPA